MSDNTLHARLAQSPRGGLSHDRRRSHNEINFMVEGADQGSMARLVRRVARLDGAVS